MRPSWSSVCGTPASAIRISGASHDLRRASIYGGTRTFVGGYGVYGQSSSGWAGEFYTTASQNGVWIGNPWNNAQLCLNGACTTVMNMAAGMAPLVRFPDLTSAGMVALNCRTHTPGAKVVPRGRQMRVEAHQTYMLPAPEAAFVRDTNAPAIKELKFGVTIFVASKRRQLRRSKH